MSEMDDPRRFLAFEDRGLILVSVAYPKMVKAIIDILTILLQEKNLSGIFISLDRPHTYIARILEKRGVPQGNLTYIDTVIGISGEKSRSEDNLVQLTSPFCMNIMADVFSPDFFEKRDFKPGFIVVDNLGALRAFVPDSCIERFLKDLNDVNSLMAESRCFIVMDKTACPDLYELIKKGEVQEMIL